MFRSLALVGIIALSSSAMAQTTWQVRVSGPLDELNYSPQRVVSQVPATQPNRHTDNLAFRLQILGIQLSSISPAPVPIP